MSAGNVECNCYNKIIYDKTSKIEKIMHWHFMLIGNIPKNISTWNEDSLELCLENRIKLALSNLARKYAPTISIKTFECRQNIKKT